ncbi:MAG TPA: D-alanine--D-alanine ligase family protein [Candidatus Saccharimonadales bacterium]|nr:D-alanine--D-alanine ligase family protein [Candidatus Saccharimonadales bacterium]
MENIAVIFGGRSAEHDVSVVTAIASIIKPLELTKKYHVEAIYIAKDGAWYWDEKLKDIKLFTSGEIQDFLHRTQPTSVQFDGGMTLVKASGIAGRKQTKKIDLVFPAMHGTYGEDGALMGLLDLAGIPYVGCGVSASAIAMNKVLAKQIAVANNIPTPKFEVFSKAQLEREPGKAVTTTQKSLKYPLFVKPAKLGSSIGISRVQNETELRNALEVAAHYDDEVLVEEAVNNLIELTLPIMGPADRPQAALLEQPLTKAEDFFDFETKYMQGGKKGKGGGKGAKGAQGYSQIPADIPEDLYDKAETTGLAVYQALGCSGIARVDMLVDSKTKAVYFNEVNPLPGGLYAHNWNKAGISNVELVQKLVAFAKERHAERQALTTVFNTNYLQQF